MKHHEERIAIRLSTELRQQAEQIIKQGKTKNLSDLVRVALTEHIGIDKKEGSQ